MNTVWSLVNFLLPVYCIFIWVFNCMFCYFQILKIMLSHIQQLLLFSKLRERAEPQYPKAERISCVLWFAESMFLRSSQVETEVARVSAFQSTVVLFGCLNEKGFCELLPACSINPKTKISLSDPEWCTSLDAQCHQSALGAINKTHSVCSAWWGHQGLAAQPVSCITELQ